MVSPTANAEGASLVIKSKPIKSTPVAFPSVTIVSVADVAST